VAPADVAAATVDRRIRESTRVHLTSLGVGSDILPRGTPFLTPELHTGYPRRYIAFMTYEHAKRTVHALQKAVGAPRVLTAEERADWAYGNAVIENDKVTRAMADEAVAKLAATRADK
jgi:hypothetical protein